MNCIWHRIVIRQRAQQFRFRLLFGIWMNGTDHVSTLCVCVCVLIGITGALDTFNCDECGLLYLAFAVRVNGAVFFIFSVQAKWWDTMNSWHTAISQLIGYSHSRTQFILITCQNVNHCQTQLIGIFQQYIFIASKWIPERIGTYRKCHQ